MEMMFATMFLLLIFTAFQVLFNVCIINTMRVNEEEVQGVSDALPSTVVTRSFNIKSLCLWF